SCASRRYRAVESPSVIPILAGLFEQFFDQSGCFQFIQHYDAFVETLLSEGFNGVFVEVMFICDFKNQLTLLVAAHPTFWTAIRRVLGVAILRRRPRQISHFLQ